MQHGNAGLTVPSLGNVAGAQGNVEEYVRQLRSLRWKAMCVRFEETERCVPGQSIDELRRFAHKHIIEIALEGGLSQLGQACERAGLEHIFLTALKISR